MDTGTVDRRPAHFTAAVVVVLAWTLGACTERDGEVAMAEAPAASLTRGGVQELPNWSGVWAQVDNTVFDQATVVPADGDANTAGVREFPPLTEEYERRYQANIELKTQGRLPDPITTCGTPAGFPRLLNLPDVYEFVVRPEETWILTENGPNVMRIYTDGRDHPAPEDLWHTFTGDSVGHWEGDTLTFSTIAVRNEGTIIDRTGLVLSDEMTAVTRMRKLDNGMLEAALVIEDSLALTEPWRVRIQYERLPDGTRVYDYACAENNRNPVSEDGETMTLDSQGRPLDFQ
jgi:hypothetical protein